MQSTASTVSDYLEALPEPRRALVSALRDVILANLDKDYVELMQYGMIGYAVPHTVFPAGYHCDPKQPLPFVGLASQKNDVSLYLMCLYENEQEMAWFRDAWAASGKKKLTMGKSCVKIKKLEDVPLAVIGEAIRRMPAQRFIAQYLAARNA